MTTRDTASWSANKIMDGREEIAKLRERIEKLEKGTLFDATKRIDELEIYLRAANEVIDSRNDRIGDMETKIDNLKAIIHAITKRIDDFNSYLSSDAVAKAVRDGWPAS